MPKAKMVKSKSKSKTEIKNEKWMELIDKKDEFQSIIAVLNRYYNLNPPKNHPSSAYRFREELVIASLDSIRVFIKRYGQYEYLIAVEILQESNKKMDSWIHIDGIQQERDELKSKNVVEHPVFNIFCISDLYSKYSQEVIDKELLAP